MHIVNIKLLHVKATIHFIVHEKNHLSVAAWLSAYPPRSSQISLCCGFAEIIDIVGSGWGHVTYDMIYVYIDSEIDASYEFYATNKRLTPSLVQHKLHRQQ